MVKYRSYLLIKSITVYNSIEKFFTSAKKRLYDFFHYMLSYSNDRWLLLDDHTLPIKDTDVKNILISPWYYFSSKNRLCYKKQSVTPIHYKLTWLSAKIVIEDQDHEIDTFLESFRMITDEVTPSLKFVFLSWCIYHGYWFKTTTDIKFHIIDNTGEEVVLSLTDSLDLYLEK